MRAVTFSSYGPPEVLRLTDVPDPHAAEGQVRVRVRAAGVQPFDTKVRSGQIDIPATFPQMLGNEFAGVVDEVGDGVSGVSVGDEVLGWAFMCCYAECVAVSAKRIVPKPAGVPWEVAGVLSASGQTAYSALQELGIGPGVTVLIHAAAGGVGTFAVQLAREWGATVIGTASERNHGYLRSLGATPVTYGEGMVERVRAVAPGGVDAALDGAGGAALRASVEIVGDRNRIGTLVDPALADELGVRALQGKRSVARLADLVDLYVRGKLRVQIAKTFPLEQAADAHREVEGGHVRGKVVLTVE